MPEPEIDTLNRFLVSVNGADNIVLLRWRQVISKSDALNLAAWLVALADDEDHFLAVLQAVRNT